MATSVSFSPYIFKHDAKTWPNGEQEVGYETNDGVLIGTNRGEWGGELTFKNDDIEYPVLLANVCGIVNYNNEIFVLTGLSHMRIFNGKIFKIENINGRWVNTNSIFANERIVAIGLRGCIVIINRENYEGRSYYKEWNVIYDRYCEKRPHIA